MANRTITAAAGLNQPEAVHAGVNALVIKLSFSTTFSPTDTIIIGKLPVNAIPLDAVFFAGSGLGGATVLKFGVSASLSMFFASLTYSIDTRFGSTKRLGISAQVSVSDDKMPRYANVTMVSAAGATLGYIGDLVIYYKVPGQAI